jgi:hypothetical protein
MDPNRRGLVKGGIVFFLCLIFGFASTAPAQRTSKRTGTTLPNSFDFTQPQLLNADTNPTLRYPIGSLVGSLCSSMAYGWLDISRTSIHFQVVQPAKRLNEGFDIRIGEISDIKIWQQSIRFRSGSKKYTIYYASENRWETIHNCPAFWDVANVGARGTGSIQEALSNFDGVLAQVKAANAPPPPIAAPPAVNPVVTTPEPKPAPPAPPAILLIAPSGAGTNPVVDAKESPLTIRGFAMDTTGIPIIKINGVPANMRPQSNQSAEFWSEPLPLQPGENPMEIIASNAAHAETKVAFVVRFTPKPAPVAPKGLSKEEIISLLQGEVPSARVAELIRERGIKFSPTDADLNQIRAEGATDELIQAIQQAAPHP